MIQIYCRDFHSTNGALCSKCENLLEYSIKRIDHCPFGTKKTVCNNCTIHCYKKDMRESIRKVMRYSGPRMLRKHPLLAILHLVDKLRKEPPFEKKRSLNNKKDALRILK